MLRLRLISALNGAPSVFRHVSRLGTFLLLAAFPALVHCGTNTEEPVFPLFTITGVGAPTITAVSSVRRITFDAELIHEFDLNYYITNGEAGFQGYNLYITTSSSSAQATVTGLGTTPYLPLGHGPSFPHVGTTPSTSTLITQRITHVKPPPGEQHFELCEKYFFRLTAVLRSGLESFPSPEISACATTDISICPSGSICNP